ncbi:MAG: metallophosphoesterase [Candidatus Micrarchaeaceae archaeon]
MILDKDIELLEGLPIAYIKSIDAFVVSDLHLGYETKLAKNGVFIPKVNVRKIISDFEKGLRFKKPGKIIVVGDIKNDFSTVDVDEFNELHEIVKFCNEKKIELILIKGNHDNFIERYRGPFKIKIYNNEAKIGDYFFAHGDKLPKFPKEKIKFLITGHEHPSIGILNSIGRVERLRCFLSGKYENINLLVLPAISYFASGSEINFAPKGNLISPILRSTSMDTMHAIAIGYGSTLDFGTIADLRKISAR